jgi:hypothetical protein
MILRPCMCDRVVPRRRFRANRDCHRCWLYAHRPAVRKAWGGNPAEVVPIPDAHPDMAAADLADLLAEHPLDLPAGWKHWPVTREAHLLLVERFLANMPAYPEGKFAGRGAVVLGGGRYEASVYVCCQMLRHVGWTHPIQVWHRGVAEPVSDRVRTLPGVEVVDILPHAEFAERPVHGGWDAKTLAILASPFEEVLFHDADSYPVYNPDECFEPRNNPHGIVVWPDQQYSDTGIHWPTYGMERAGHALSGGHYLFTKRKAWPVLQLAHHYDSHSNYYYAYTGVDVKVGGFGDQEQMRVALLKFNAPHARYTDAPLSLECNSFLLGGPCGRPLFVHRHANKHAETNAFATPPQWYPGRLPMEATAWRYFLEWLTTPVGLAAFPEEVPGEFSEGECRLWHAACRDRDVLELGRHHGRSVVVAAGSARKVVSLDRVTSSHADGWLQRYGLRHKVWLREGDFATLVPTSGGPFTACLIDGDHDRQSVEADVATALPHLAAGAVMGFRNYDNHFFPDVRVVVDEAAARHGWQLVSRADNLAVFEI